MTYVEYTMTFEESKSTLRVCLQNIILKINSRWFIYLFGKKREKDINNCIFIICIFFCYSSS